MNIDQYEFNSIAIVLFVVILTLVLVEGKESQDEQTFITKRNFHNLVKLGISFILLGIFLHLVFGYLENIVLAPPIETILELLMLKKVSDFGSSSIAFGYGFLIGAIVLKISNIFFILKNKNENDI